MEKLQPGKINTMRGLRMVAGGVLAAGALALSGSRPQSVDVQILQPNSDQNQTVQVGLPPIPENWYSLPPIPQSIYDYCEYHDDFDEKYARYLAGEDVADVFLPGDKEALKQLNSDQLKIVSSKWPIGKYQALIVPVGYDDSQERFQKMSTLINRLTDQYKGIDVQFHFLDNSLPITIKRIEHLGLVDEEEVNVLRGKMSEVAPINGYMFVVNTEEDEWFGGGGDNLAVIPGGSPLTDYAASHEEGHAVGGRSDKYRRRYDRSTGGIPNSESSLLDPQTGERIMEPKLAKVYKETSEPSRFQIVGKCEEMWVIQPFDNLWDVMGEQAPYWPETYDLIVEEKGSVFSTPQEKHYMNTTISDLFTNK